MLIQGVYYNNITCTVCRKRHPEWVSCEQAATERINQRERVRTMPSPTSGVRVSALLAPTHLRYLVRIITTGHVTGAFENHLDAQLHALNLSRDGTTLHYEVFDNHTYEVLQ